MRAAWHIHHRRLVEPLTSPIEERRRSIREHKPRGEVALRLRLLRVARGLPRDRLWRASVEAWRAYQATARVHREAGQAYDEAGVYREAWRVYWEAGQAYREAWVYREAGRVYDQALRVYEEVWGAYLAAHRETIERLHREQCAPDCPWDGETIFPERA